MPNYKKRPVPETVPGEPIFRSWLGGRLCRLTKDNEQGSLRSQIMKRPKWRKKTSVPAAFQML